jgi:hypothetical protein
VKAQELSKGRLNITACAIWPRKPPVPQKVVQNGCLDSQPSREKIVHFHRDQNGQHEQLDADSDGSYQGKPEQTAARVRAHASLSSL